MTTNTDFSVSSALPDSAISTTPREFSEAPISTLLNEDLLQMSDAELASLLTEINSLASVPGALTRALNDESVSLVAKGTAARKPRTKKVVDVSSLL